MSEYLFNCDEFEATCDVRGIELSSQAGDTIVVVGSDPEVMDFLRRIADNLGEYGATVEWRDPGPAESDRALAARAFGVDL